MMKTLLYSLLVILYLQRGLGQNQTPVIQSFSIQADVANGTASLNYQLEDAENDALEVTVQLSADGGKTYSTLSGPQVVGDVGVGVLPGSRAATCSGLDFSLPGQYVFRIIADDQLPFDIQALVNEVDSNRLRNDLEFLEGIRHRNSGLALLNETRDSIRSLFGNAGLHVETHNFIFSGSTGQNLIGSLPGTESDKQIYIADAHYDSAPIAPGADDNGSGVVGVMEMARLLSRYPSKKTQRYIGFDMEEDGLRGSLNYRSSGILPDESIEGVFNFEMIGYWSDQPNTQTLPSGFSSLFPAAAQEVANNQYRGDFISNVGNGNSQPLATKFYNAAQQYVPALKVISLNVPGNGQIVPDLRRSDHAPFWDAGFQALMLTDGANFRNPYYHSPGDTLGNLNFTFMSNVVKATLAAMAEAVEIQHADWATAAFEVSTGTSEPSPCSFTILQANGLFLQPELCFSGAYELECYDLKGALMTQQKILLQNGARFQLPTLSLTPGIYVFKLRNSQGIYAQKVHIH